MEVVKACFPYNCFWQCLNASFAFYKQLMIMPSRVKKNIFQNKSRLLCNKMGFISILYIVSNYFLWMNRLRKKIPCFSAVIKFLLADFLLRLWAVERMILIWIEEARKVLCIVTEYYCSALCACSKGPIKRKCGIRQAYKWFSTLVGRLIIKATCSEGNSLNKHKYIFIYR